MTNTAVEIRNLTKVFEGKEVLRGCNLTVQSGTIYGLLGANGAGKTTMFKLITGLLSPTAGNIKVQGETLSINKKDFLGKMGILIETPVFYDHLSARENLEIHLSYMEHSFGKIEQVLEMVGLGDTGKQPVSKFSLGMKQRLAIGRAISHSPQILILDEPINGLDPMGIRQIRNLFLSLAKDGMTLLISSHVLSEVEHIADVVGVLTNGNVVQEVAISEIKKQYPNGLEEYFFQIMSGGAGA
ncbi:ABC transporter ATP-binding protein [Murimonas intestini]|uniref:ABC-2 type transport system ATP-binding protein n=1 Tax=Murimonas intestini TaxID=1337051 RepID=A0AB73TAT7_9FIRM|nr:ATP-binding cassette domain-containing protein [Murimonas intestini]MCR1838913.1 ATP-binding cassette domain-containing protein [Murimonas intestini]MCR1864210.1 ATP-binding cassette domain-containing protein [Murimonas intestini]MCR1881820.1 ATP-binding cassette domain-containing protein [Murimonas intestini]